MLSRRITYYIKALCENFDISLLCIKDAEHPHIEHYEKARILRVPLKQGSLVQRAEQFERAVRRQLESEDYLVAHCFDFVSGRILADLKKQLGYHLVFEATTLSSLEWPHSQLECALSVEFLETMKSVETHAALRSNALIVASQQQKNCLHSKAGLQLPIHVVPHPALPRKGIPRQPTSYFQFLHLGGSSQLASLQTTLNAFKALPQELKIQLALGGHYDAKSKTHLAALKESLDAKENVVWPSLKHETETRALCAQANAALLVLEHEPRNLNFGGAMPELADFFTWELPIIASDLPCVREFLSEEEALFFAPGDDAMLAERMKELAASPQLQTRLGLASAQKADAFSPSKFMQETLRVYQPWLDRQMHTSEQLLEPLPDITPSRAKTTSHPFASFPSREQDTIIVPPASLCPSPE